MSGNRTAAAAARGAPGLASPAASGPAVARHSGDAPPAGITTLPAAGRATSSSSGGCPAARLSGREREVLALLAEGASNLEVAVTLFISVNTVERHVSNICAKLGARGRTAAVARAIRGDLI
jgi:DNA-binding CsgD family transcriptional regulator